MAKLYLFCPSSGLYSCPLAMTDGAAKVIETVLSDPDCDSRFLQEPFKYYKYYLVYDINISVIISHNYSIQSWTRVLIFHVLIYLINNLEIAFFKPNYRKLTTTDCDEFWTSGQWMTEKQGGSDVGNLFNNHTTYLKVRRSFCALWWHLIFLCFTVYCIFLIIYWPQMKRKCFK